MTLASRHQFLRKRRVLKDTHGVAIVSVVSSEEWKSGRVEEWKSGRVEEWKSGRVEEWKSGRVEEWKSGRVEEWKSETEKELKKGEKNRGY